MSTKLTVGTSRPAGHPELPFVVYLRLDKERTYIELTPERALEIARSLAQQAQLCSRINLPPREK